MVTRGNLTYTPLGLCKRRGMGLRQAFAVGDRVHPYLLARTKFAVGGSYGGKPDLVKVRRRLWARRRRS